MRFALATRKGIFHDRPVVRATQPDRGRTNRRVAGPFVGADPDLVLVARQRAKRNNILAKRWASKFANKLRGAELMGGTRDSGCGPKAFRRTAYLELPYFDHMHRYLPALFLREGWKIE